MPKGTSQDCCIWCLAPVGSHSWPMPPKESLITSRWIWSCLLWGPGSWCIQDFVYALQEWSLCFPWSCGNPVIKYWWLSKSDSLGIPSPFAGSLGWEAWCGVQNLHNSGRTSLVLLFSSLWVSYLAGMVFHCIVIVPLLLFIGASPLSLDVGYLFLVGSSVFQLMVVQ